MKFSNKIFLVLFILFSIFFLNTSVNVAHAETSSYRSAGWVATDGIIPYSSTTGCQVSDDGQYCSRTGNSSGATLYFGSFGNLEEFGIPLNSVINRIKFRIKGRTSGSHYLSVTNAYNKIPFSSICQKPSDLIIYNLGLTDNVIEKNYAITLNNGLLSCINGNNINFRNLTFAFGNYLSSGWSADIDNFEIAFDYTPPAVSPTPVVFPEGQQGTVWEIGPDKSELKQVAGLDNVIYVATGIAFSMALKSDGTVWVWESGNAPTQLRGENGVGFITGIKKVAAGGSFGIALKSDGTLWEWIQTSEGPGVPIKNNAVGALPIIDIAAGRAHKLALSSNGNLFGWGLNTDGQVGIGCMGGNCSVVNGPRTIDSFKDVSAIAAGASHSLALKKDGSVWGWGSQSFGQLGEGLQDVTSGNYIDRSSPVQLNGLINISSISTKANYNLAKDANGKMIEWGGAFDRRIPRFLLDLHNASSISAGWISFSPGVVGHYIREDKTVWQVYINDISSKQVPVLKNVFAVASGYDSHSLAVVNSPGEVLGDSTVAPFLDLPWDYKKHGLSFNDASMAINSFFDHSYPLLSTNLAEPLLTSEISENYDPRDQVTTYMDEKSSEKSYTKHDGYDWGKIAKAFVDEDQLAAASGSAVYVNSCKPCGEAVHIDHHNGFQTRYYHLNSIEDKIKTANEPVSVAQGEKVGTIGFSGNVVPKGDNGAHIHFMVIQDKNNDGNFSDNIPDGLVDPFGWQSDEFDPWEKYVFNYAGKDRNGNKSHYLWQEKTPSVTAFVDVDQGKEIEIENYRLKYSAGAAAINFTFRGKSVPYIQEVIDGSELRSVCTPLDATATDSIGNLITQFLVAFSFEVDFSKCNLFNIDFESLAIFSKPSDGVWRRENTAIDIKNKKASSIIPHMTTFALMGERLDMLPPITSPSFEGAKGQGNNYRSDIEVTLTASDGVDGVGVEYTAYKKAEEWLGYNNPLIFSQEGAHSISYFSEDNDGNMEDVKSTEFFIDKTSSISTANVEGVEGLNNWFVSNVKVKLGAKDAGSGVWKIEYSLDGEEYKTYSSEIEIETEGANKVYYRSIDKAGNVEEIKEFEVKIDKTTPNSIVYTSGARGEDNWYRSNVEIGINGYDSVSGYKTSYYSLDGGENYFEVDSVIILSSEGLHRVHYYSVDDAGNVEDTKNVEIRIDKTSPIVLIDANPSSLWPPNGIMMDVNITGEVDEKNPFNTSFKVIDEYNLIEPLLINFNQTIKLHAKRNSNDYDGRIYKIEAISTDLAGNDDSASLEVIVPHDQR